MKIYQITVLASLRPVFNVVVVVEDVGEAVSVSPSLLMRLISCRLTSTVSCFPIPPYLGDHASQQ